MIDQEAIVNLSARFSRLMSQLGLGINATGDLLVYQTPRMYKFPVVGFYGYSQEFEKSMLKSVEVIGKFNPFDYSADELMHMYQAGLSIANYHRIAAEHGIGSNYHEAVASYRAVIEMVGDDESVRCLRNVDEFPGAPCEVNGMSNNGARKISALAFCGLAMCAVRTGSTDSISGLITAAIELDQSTIAELHVVRLVALAKCDYETVYIMARDVFLKDAKYRKEELDIFDADTQKSLIQ
jgi:hypothetical protein